MAKVTEEQVRAARQAFYAATGKKRGELHDKLLALEEKVRRQKGAAKDVEPVGTKKYICITKDGKRHDIEAENAHAANFIAEKRFGYANISVPPQESLRVEDASASKSVYGNQAKLDAAVSRVTGQGFSFYKTLTYNSYAEHVFKDSTDRRAYVVERPSSIRVQYEKPIKAEDAQPDPEEGKRWKQHMHQDGLWCGDVNCKTCAKSGAMAKGVKEMKRAKDAEVKPVGDAACPLCKYPMSGSKCDNPGCEASGNVPPVIIERRKKEAAEQAERTRISKLRNASYAKNAEVQPVKYNGEVVQKEINKDKRIGGKEAKAVHALLKGRAGDASPFDVDTDAGAERIVRREAKAGLTAAQIARKHGFSLSFVKEVLGGSKTKDGAESARQELERKLKEARHEMNAAKRDGSSLDYQRYTADIVKRLERELASAKDAAFSPAEQSTLHRLLKEHDQLATAKPGSSSHKRLQEVQRELAKLRKKANEVKPVGDGKSKFLVVHVDENRHEFHGGEYTSLEKARAALRKDRKGFKKSFIVEEDASGKQTRVSDSV